MINFFLLEMRCDRQSDKQYIEKTIKVLSKLNQRFKSLNNLFKVIES